MPTLFLGALALGCVSATPRWTPDTVALPKETPEGLGVPAPIEQRAEPVPPVSAEANRVKLTRDGALITALRNNRDMDVARFGPRIGETYIPEARAAFDPTLLGTVSYGHIANPANVVAGMPGVVRATTTSSSLTLQETLPTGTRLFLSGDMAVSSRDVHQGEATIGIEQPLLKGAGLNANLVALRQARNRAAQSGHAFRAVVLATVRQVETAYWNLALANEVLAIRQFALKLADEQLQRAESLFAVGKAIEGDVAAARAEKASRGADLTDAMAAIRAQTVALVRLINPGGAQAWNVEFDLLDAPETTEVNVDADESEKLAVVYRPELAEARLAAANAELAVAGTRNDRLPQVNLVGTYGRISHGTEPGDGINHFGDTPYDNYQIGLNVRTPILNRAERARHTRSRLAAEQANRSVANVEQGIVSEVRQAAIQVARYWERIPATREAVASRTEQLRVAQGRYEAGMTTELDLMIVQRDLIHARIEEVQARVSYIQALTALYAAEGTLLERRGIALDMEEDR
ncbi:MAG TPA: TolC family protein [Candidatus Hydrogenedentes bacterium]|nr:TolC family protein [Candidatus Hydrogenedentota bacterium]